MSFKIRSFLAKRLLVFIMVFIGLTLLLLGMTWIMGLPSDISDWKIMAYAISGVSLIGAVLITGLWFSYEDR